MKKQSDHLFQQQQRNKFVSKMFIQVRLKQKKKEKEKKEK